MGTHGNNKYEECQQSFPNNIFIIQKTGFESQI